MKHAIVRESLSVLGIALLATVLCAFFHPKRPTWYQVVPEDVKRWSIDEERAKQLISEGEVLWVDARPASKFQEQHYPGAISLDLENWADLMFEHQLELQNALNQPVIVYCDGTRCEKSREVAQKLRQLAGLDPVYLLQGKWQNLLPE